MCHQLPSLRVPAAFPSAVFAPSAAMRVIGIVNRPLFEAAMALPPRNFAPHVLCNTGGRTLRIFTVTAATSSRASLALMTPVTQPDSACAAAVTAPRRVRRRVNLQRLRLMCATNESSS